jgi:hypothetical protein
MDLTKKKYIKTLLLVGGMMVLALSMIKYFIVNAALPPFVAPLEILALLMLIAFFYYFFVNIRSAYDEINELKTQLQHQKSKTDSRESQLLQKIMHLEEKEKEKEIFNLHKQKTLNKILGKIDKTNRTSIKTSIVQAISSVLETVTIISYWYDDATGDYKPNKTFAIDDEFQIKPFKVNEGFCGQAIAEKKLLSVDDIPADYISALSGLGSHQPKYIYFAPIEIDGKVSGLLEIGSFKQLEIKNFWSELSKKIEELYLSINE